MGCQWPFVMRQGRGEVKNVNFLYAVIQVFVTFFQQKTKKNFVSFGKSSIFALRFEKKRELFERLNKADVTQLVE